MSLTAKGVPGGLATLDSGGHLTASVGPAHLGVRDTGAVGDGVADDTDAIQAAIDALPAAGGVVYLPTGTYKLTDALTLRSNLTVLGDGDGATVVRQTGADKDAMTGSALTKVTVQGVYFAGTGAGTGSGLALTKGANPATTYVTLRDVTFESFGRDGVSVENPIVSSFDRVLAVTNGRYGINLFGQNGGAAGTSCALNACYGNANGTAGIRLFNMVYSGLNACAADHNPIGYLIDGCQALTLSGCGAEGNATNGLKVNAGFGVTVAGLWVYDNRAVGVLVTGSAATVTLIAATDNTPNGTATSFITVAAGSHATLLGCNNTTANSLASGTTNVASDAGGGAVINGYAALLNGGEFDNDLTCFVSAKGIVLTDRSDSNRYRLKVTGGTLGVELV